MFCNVSFAFAGLFFLAFIIRPVCAPRGLDLPTVRGSGKPVLSGASNAKYGGSSFTARAAVALAASSATAVVAVAAVCSSASYQFNAPPPKSSEPDVGLKAAQSAQEVKPSQKRP
eukprot:6198329-Pleurochrysis_carterae.AAC.2